MPEPIHESLDPITDLITEAVNDADLGDDTTLGDTPEDLPITEGEETPPEGVVMDDDEEEPVVPEGEQPPAEKEPKDKPPVDPDDLTNEELAALGIKPLKPGERPNKIPRDRVIQMMGKAVKQRAAAHKKALDEIVGKHATSETELVRFRQLDQLATTDPEKYVRTLAALKPEQYGRFAAMLDGTSPAGQTTVPGAKDDPRPDPDAKFPDGSTGYSAEQHEKLLAWNRREAIREFQATMASELKPFKDRDKAQADYAARVEKVHQQVLDVKETWGALYPKDGTPEQTELAKYLEDHPELSFKAGVAAWMQPRITTDRKKIRSEVMDEVTKRGKKQERTPPAGSKPGKEPNAEQSIDDVIMESVAAAGLK